MKIFLDMVGCRLNQSEIDTYARQFRQAGHSLVSTPQEADLVVINTCSVTAAAAADSRQKIRQAQRAQAKEIAVTGCWSTLNPVHAAALPGVTSVISNAQKDLLVSDLLGVAPEAFDLEPLQREAAPGPRLRTRAFIKVQDGCDNRCTFCVTTLARGPARSRPVEQILREVNQEGVQEAVLTGVHLGSWGQDFSPPLHLQHLIAAILNDSPIPRLRLSSLEPWDLDEDFFRLWQNPRLCRHLHLPLQSGSAATLRRMARKTTPAAFASLVQAARAAIPGVAITTDLITGFPGENEAEFAETLDFVKGMGFAGGHVFTYSAREGTAAARMPGQVPVPVRRERNGVLRGMLAEAARSYREKFLGQTLEVLWEHAETRDGQTWETSGLTDNYLRVKTQTNEFLWNQVRPARLVSLGEDWIEGNV